MNSGHTFFRVLARCSAWLFLSSVLLITACGGGGADPTSSTPSKYGLQLTTPVTPTATVVAVTKLSETRVSRTVYDYVFKITVQNGDQALTSLKAKLVAVGAGTTILDGDVDVGSVAANELVAPTDTIKLRHDRALPFDLAAFRWEFTGSNNVALTQLTLRIAETGTGNPVTVYFLEEATLRTALPLSWQFTKLPDGASAPALMPGNNGLRVVFTPTAYGTYELRATDGIDAISVWVSSYAKPGFDEAAVQAATPGSDWRTVGGTVTNQYIFTTKLTRNALAQVFTKYPTLSYLGQSSRVFHEVKLREITPRGQAELASFGFESDVSIVSRTLLMPFTLTSVEGCRTTLTAAACDGDPIDTTGGNWHIAESKINKAWQLLGNTGSPDIHIGVMDGGYNFNHEDITWLQGGGGLPKRLRYGFNDGNAKDSAHGTAVLGIMGGQIGNGVGITGINGAATFVTSTLNHETFTIENGGTKLNPILLTTFASQLDEIAMFSPKVKVINGSWADDITSDRFTNEQASDLLGRAHAKGLAYRTMLLDAELNNKLFIFGAGNGLDNVGPGIDARFTGVAGAIQYQNSNLNGDPDCAASLTNIVCPNTSFSPLDNVLLVGAYDRSRLLKYYSNFGKAVQIAAPTDIRAPHSDKSNYWGDIHLFGDNVKIFNGTSAAAPVVSGVASLVFSVDPSFTAADVKGILVQSAQQSGEAIEKRKSIRPSAFVDSNSNPELLDSAIPVLNAERAIQLAKDFSEGRELLASVRLESFVSGNISVQLKAGKSNISGALNATISALGGGNSVTGYSAAASLGVGNTVIAPLAIQGGVTRYRIAGTTTFSNSGIVTANSKPFSVDVDVQTIDVEVKSATGAAVAGAQVSFTCESVIPQCPTSSPQTSTGLGKARFYATPGAYRVKVTRSGFQDSEQRIQVNATPAVYSAQAQLNNIQVVSATLAAASSPVVGELTGLVSSPTGALLVGAAVQVTGGGSTVSTTTDAQGRYTLSAIRVTNASGQPVYDHEVRVISPPYKLAVSIVPVLGNKVQTYNVRLETLHCNPPEVGQYGSCTQIGGPSNSLISRYSFDSTLLDGVRGSSDQIQLNTGTPTYTFRGNSGALLIPQGTHLTGGSVLSDLMKSTQNYSFTVSTWVKFNNNAATPYRSIIYERDTSGNDFCGQGATNYGLSSYQGKWLFQVTTLTDAGACKNIASIFADTGPVADTWYHLATTFDHLTGTASIYVNGSLIKSVTGLGNRVQTSISPRVAIGNQPTALAPTQFMNGAMDDLRFYSRALSAQEILTLQ